MVTADKNALVTHSASELLILRCRRPRNRRRRTVVESNDVLIGQ